MSKNSIIKGTLILTLAGFLTRIIGFFYRIYLSNALGAENMGLYQLIFPLYGICYTLYASGLQTSISRMIASELGKKDASKRKSLARILRTGLFTSLSIAITLSIIVFFFSDFIATRLLAEPDCASSVKLLAIVFPFCGVTACINGYYYGFKKTGVPASTQLIEQVVRVIFVLTFASVVGKGNTSITCEVAVLGLIVGEIGSMFYNVFCMIVKKPRRAKYILLNKTANDRGIFVELMKLAVPLTSNRLLISILNSVESVLIPIMLRQAGLSTSEALSVFGVLVGMALPFIFFPSAITNSLAVLLLPTISEAQAQKNDRLISKTTELAFKYCLIIGILSTGIFITFGNTLGESIYHSAMAGNFIVTLAWLCPFLYLTTTLSSIINGLGKAHVTFINSVVGLTIRILFVIFAVPKYGISGYLVGVLFSQLAISTLDFLAILRNIKISFDAVNWVLIPGVAVGLLSYIFTKLYQILIVTTSINKILLVLVSAIVFAVVFLILLLITKTISIKEFSQTKDS